MKRLIVFLLIVFPLFFSISAVSAETDCKIHYDRNTSQEAMNQMLNCLQDRIENVQLMADRVLKNEKDLVKLLELIQELTKKQSKIDKLASQLETELTKLGKKTDQINQNLSKLSQNVADEAFATGELISIAFDAEVQNESQKPLIIFGNCNITEKTKTIEGFIGETRDKMEVVSSESGSDQGAITFVVPPNWYYRISYEKFAGIKCKLKGWKF